ncbi:hypothetical protein ACP4OV_002058 [Aristida adscensionis]
MASAEMNDLREERPSPSPSPSPRRRRSRTETESESERRRSINIDAMGSLSAQPQPPQRNLATQIRSRETEREKMARGEEQGEAAPSGARRTKLVPVKQEYIDSLLKRATLNRTITPMSEDFLLQVFPDDPARRERIRRRQADTLALLERFNAEDQDIVHQYHTKGFAMQEVEVRDGDDK